MECFGFVWERHINGWFLSCPSPIFVIASSIAFSFFSHSFLTFWGFFAPLCFHNKKKTNTNTKTKKLKNQKHKKNQNQNQNKNQSTTMGSSGSSPPPFPSPPSPSSLTPLPPPTTLPGSRTTAEDVSKGIDMKGKNVIVTGGNTGFYY